MTNEALIGALRTELQSIKKQSGDWNAEAAATYLLDIIEENWTEGSTPPCGLQESPLMATVLDSQNMGRVKRTREEVEARGDYLTLFLMGVVEQADEPYDAYNYIKYAIGELERAAFAASELGDAEEEECAK